MESQPPPPRPVSPGSIRSRIEVPSVDKFRHPPYLPENAFPEFLQRKRVEASIQQKFGSYTEDERRRLVDYTIQNPRVFFTLVVSELIEKMPLLCFEKFADRHLPVRCKAPNGKDWQVYSVADSQNNPWKCFARDYDGSNSWSQANVDHFVWKQWIFLAVIFYNKTFKYVIQQDRPLPYVELATAAPTGGYFATVSKFGLRKEHIRPDVEVYKYLRKVPYKSTTVLEIAVKRLHIDGAKSEELARFFRKETRTLKTMRELRHDHLIQAISAYERGLERCFVFPWATEGNLRHLWARTRGPTKECRRKWAWGQIQGLTDGLKWLHKQNTRHGDIKPENILGFRSGNSIRLVIADVGIAKFHAQETRKRQAQGYWTTNQHGTLRYEPPEIERYKPQAVSRRYDSWSLGCVLLEFVIWLLRGSDGQTLFNKQLEANSNRFWDQKGIQKPVLNPVVERWINQELHQDLANAPLLRDLVDLVADYLLVTSSGSRAYIADFCERLQQITIKCSADPYYLLKIPDTGLTGPRDCAAEVVNDFVVPISQGKTSKLVDKWETVPDPSLIRELFDGLKWSQWPQTRPLTDSPGHLCRDCTAITFASQSYEFSRSMQGLYEAAAECTLCGFLYRRLSALEAKPQEPVRLVRVGSTLEVYPISRPIISLYCDPVSVSTRPALPFAQVGFAMLPEAASPKQFALLNFLIHHCDEVHDCMAVPKHAESPAELPTRVIDVGRDDAEPIRLIETSHELAVTGRYIALSHRWGDLSRAQRCCTYADNIAQRKVRIEYDTLPASFQDAVRVTRALGVRYLWIDSLCIVQEDAKDWAVQAGRMEDVFSHAYCTIAASSAASSLVGFLGHRRPRDAIKLSTPGGAPLYLAEHIDDFRADVENSVLSSRGWVLQERALSRRTIYFTSTQVYWECGNGVVCETLTQLRNTQSQFLGDSNFPYFGLQFYKDERIRLVQHFFEAYSALSLSQTPDRAQAVVGLQRRIARAFKSPTSYGIVWHWKERTLLWRAVRPGALTRIDYRHSATKPPSWSWMASDGRIEFLEIPFASIEWTGNVRELSGPEAEEGRVAAEANGLRVDGTQLMDRAILDTRGVDFFEDSWKCVLIGKNKESDEEEGCAQYVLLIRPISSPSDQPGDLYERVGIATLLASHLSAEMSSVFVV